MPREQELLKAFIEFADTIVDDYDVVEFLHRLATRCVELVDASEAGIMLTDRDGKLHYVASSSERMRLIELFELQHDEGPCLNAYRDGVEVHCGLDEYARERWPRFASHAREVGFGDIATIGILQERAVNDSRVVTSQLEGALESRVVIEQAKGIVAEHNGIAVDTAFELLRAYARTHNSLLRQTAQQIIDGTLSSDALIEPTRSTRD